LLEGILRAEDQRASGAAELPLLFRGLSSPDTLLLRRACRALGRLERPVLAERIFPLLAHPQPGVRGEAAQAVAQAAQGFRSDSFPVGRGSMWGAIVAALGERVPEEQDPSVRGMLALSLGRLPYGSPEEIARAREWVLSLGERLRGAPLLDAARGMASLARLTARRVPLSETMLVRLRELAREEQADTRIRRAALGGLLAAQAADSGTLERAMGASDPQLRRLALSGTERLPAGDPRERLLRTGLADSASMVRYEALGCSRARQAGPPASVWPTRHGTASRRWRCRRWSCWVPRAAGIPAWRTCWLNPCRIPRGPGSAAPTRW